jgi:hypothetical protein
VAWRLRDVPLAARSQAPPLPARYTELCALHLLWLYAPREIGIPLTCAAVDRQPEYWAAVKLSPYDLDATQALVVRQTQYSEGSSEVYSELYRTWIDLYSDSVALALFFDFVVATYGRDRLPALLTALVDFMSMDSPIPAVLGVSVEEFEDDWHAYLATLGNAP